MARKAGRGIQVVDNGDEMRHWLFFGNFVRLYILRHAAREPVSAKSIETKLERHGYRLSRTRLRAMLDALKRAGYLTSFSVDGRNYHEITAQGRRVIEVARAQLRKLAGELGTTRPGGRHGSIR